MSYNSHRCFKLASNNFKRHILFCFQHIAEQIRMVSRFKHCASSTWQSNTPLHSREPDVLQPEGSGRARCQHWHELVFALEQCNRADAIRGATERRGTVSLSSCYVVMRLTNWLVSTARTMLVWTRRRRLRRVRDAMHQTGYSPKLLNLLLLKYVLH